MDRRTAEMLAERERKAAAWPRLSKIVRTLDNTKVWIKARRRVVALTSALSVVLFIGSYHQYVAKPAEHRARVEAEARAVEHMKAATAIRSAALDDCLTKAKTEADARWNAACRREGKRAGCWLSGQQTDLLKQQEGAARNGCLVRYSLTQ